jgi:hypothetical protein
VPDFHVMLGKQSLFGRKGMHLAIEIRSVSVGAPCVPKRHDGHRGPASSLRALSLYPASPSTVRD